MQKIQWNSSKEGAREKALAKLPISKIEGPAPQFWKKALPLKNDQFRGQEHLENAPKFFCTTRTYIKFTFCKKIGPNRPIQPSAVVRIFHCRSYGVPTTNWWSIQRANEQYRDHLVGQLTRMLSSALNFYKIHFPFLFWMRCEFQPKSLT